MSKRGRPRQHGERYPSGDLKTDGVSPAQWQRIRTEIVKQTKDDRFGSQIARLSFHREITDAQAAAAFRIREIYQRWHHLRGLRVVPKTPNWEQGFGSADLAEERMTTSELEQHEAAIHSAKQAWDRIQGFLQSLRRELRSALYSLCVVDEPFNPTLLSDVRAVLDQLAIRWQEVWHGQKSTVHRKAALRSSTAAPEVLQRAMPKRDDPGLRAVEAIARKLRPDLLDDDVRKVRDTYLALVDRERFRAKKGKRPL